MSATDPVVRAFAFSAGGFDSVMQLGVAHALLITYAEAPDYIVGVSAGAINATALAEVLQAGGVEEDRERKLAMQTDRLREFINANHEVRASLLDSILPDSLEIFASAPLDPLKSPLHFEEERQMRDKANASKAGLIDVFNAFFGIRLTVATITRLIRRLLGIIEAGEKPTWWGRVWTEFSNQRGLLATLWRRLVPVSDLFGKLLWAAMWSDHIRELRGWRPFSASAGTLLTRWRLTRWVGRAVKGVLKVALTAVVLALVTAGWIGIWVPFVIPFAQIKRSKRLRGARSTSAIWERILGYYSLRDGLANTDVLRQEIIRCFDQKYYGQVKVDTAIPRALGHDTTLNKTTHEQRKRIGDYAERLPKIGLGIIAADVESGNLRVLPRQIPIVDALTAAIALVPFFPAVAIDPEGEAKHARAAKKKYAPATEQPEKAWYIDGSNISTQAIAPLMGYLRDEIPSLKARGKTRIDVYPVATLPIEKGKMPSAGEIEKGVVHTAARALQLQQLRDATLERRLTTLYTRAIKPDMYKTVGRMTWVAADLYPIELDQPAGLNALMLLSSDQTKQRSMVSATIAAGCRATMEVVMRNDLRNAANVALTTPHVADRDIIAANGAVLCRMALRRRLGKSVPLPGVTAQNVPGIEEICRRCTFYLSDEVTLAESANVLTKRIEKDVPDWPVRDDPPKTAPATVTPPPREQKESPFPEHPVRAMLFGGGVFRGVCQVGVLNAANEVGLEPHVVAGASVGSIMAAMIARVFRAPRGDDRHLRIGRLAATFLAIDRLVLTDRMADFVRRLTLRAGHTAFSPYDFDRVLRRFDEDGALAFGKRARRTAAGIERLLYISPFELGELVKQMREDHRDSAGADLLEDVQDFLRRGGIGEEILGSEPLRLLIELHVLDNVSGDLRDVLLDYFSKSENGGPKLQFFATTTDVTEGKLVHLSSDDREREPSLLYSLLASSAFPVVFRPRTSWEVFRRTKETTHFLDGGIMDNLPLYAVADHLNRVLSKPEDRRPPAGPHLLFTASLETDRLAMKAGGWDVERTRRSWRLLRERAKTFTYNRKIDVYARAQRDLRRLVRACGSKNGVPLLDLEVVAVKPTWLCGTFGFHPMLGFKRWKQAASIAHGCASTFGTMVAHEEANKGRMTAWKVKLTDIDETAIQLVPVPPTGREPALEEFRPRLVPQARYANGKPKPDGTCWFRTSKLCPFSRQATKDVQWVVVDAKDKRKLNDKYIDELEQIYTACGLKENHAMERA